MNVSNRQQLLMILAGAAVALLMGDRLVFEPLIHTWQDRSQHITELKKSIAQGDIVVARDRVIREQWDNMRTNTLPMDLSVAQYEVVKAFDRWSEQSRISVSGLKTTWKRSAEDYLQLECRADAFGSIDTVARFLYEMEKDPLALRVESLEITARDNNGQQISVALQVSGLRLGAEDL